MIEIDGNYIEFIKIDRQNQSEMFFNGINTYSTVNNTEYEDDSYRCEFKAFCEMYMKSKTEPFRSVFKTPKSKFVDNAILNLITDHYPHLLIG